MRKRESTQHFGYRLAYRKLRLNSGHFDEQEYAYLDQDAVDCAVESMDYFDSEFSGWINRRRMSRFLEIRFQNRIESEIPC